MTERPLLFLYFEDTVKILLDEFERSARQNADLNRGKNRENFCSNFLKKVLPSRLNIRSGEIWDSKGNKTGQLDLVIIRDDAPCLHIGSDEIFLAESVFAVIEVKSDLTTKKLKEAAKTLKKVANLSINPPPPIFNPKYHRPLKVVFAYHGATIKTLVEFANTEKIDLKAFDIICILDRGILYRGGLVLGKEIKSGKWDEFFSLSGGAGALGFLYLHLVRFGSGFVSGLFDIADYFEPVGKWES